MNQKIRSIKDIIKSDLNRRKATVLVYNGFDCQACVDKGYQIIKRIDIADSSTSFIIASNTNISADQLRNDYPELVYHDVHESMRKELKFMPTPVILSLDENYKIIDAFFPLNIEQGNDLEEFIERIK